MGIQTEKNHAQFDESLLALEVDETQAHNVDGTQAHNVDGHELLELGNVWRLMLTSHLLRSIRGLTTCKVSIECFSISFEES